MSLGLDVTTQAITKRYSTPFGAPRGSTTGTWPDDKGFLNKPADTTTGLTHIGAREYDPLLGRFVSVDPLLETDKPQTLNGYSYAANNPGTFSDPTGEGLACHGNDPRFEEGCGTGNQTHGDGSTSKDGDPTGGGVHDYRNTTGDGTANSTGASPAAGRASLSKYLNAPALPNVKLVNWLDEFRKMGYKGSDKFTRAEAAKFMLGDKSGQAFELVCRLGGGNPDKCHGAMAKALMPDYATPILSRVFVQAGVCVVVLCGNVSIQNGTLMLQGGWTLPWKNAEAAARSGMSFSEFLKKGALGGVLVVGVNTDPNPRRQNAGSMGVCVGDGLAGCVGGAPASGGNGPNAYVAGGIGEGITFNAGKTWVLNW